MADFLKFTFKDFGVPPGPIPLSFPGKSVMFQTLACFLYHIYIALPLIINVTLFLDFHTLQK